MTPTIALPNQVASNEYSYRDHPLIVSRGSPLPEGATPTPSGVNFVLICRHGTALWLVLAEPCDGEIHAEIPLDPICNRTGDHWHIRVDGLPEEFCYGYRVDGPRGQRSSFRPRNHLDRPGRPRTFVCPAFGRRGQLCRAAP